MNQDSYAVRVQNLSKIYRLWDSKSDRVLTPAKRMLSNLIPTSIWNPDVDKLKGYRQFYALNNINFDIKEGESWGFVGVNGSGKSTLLKIISGNLRPSAGRVEVEGKVAILDYGSGFNGEFTGKENIYIKATLLGLSRKQINQRFQSIIDFAELGDFIEQPVRTYSSGMVSRLGFAIMAHVDADIIITDEALAVGDIFFVQKCMKFIRGFLKRGTFLFVSHSMNDVMSLCEKAVWLEHGNVKAVGSAADITRAYLDKQITATGMSILSAEEGEKEVEEPIKSRDNVVALTQPHISHLMDYKIPQVYTDMRLRYPSLPPHARNDIHVIPAEFITESGLGGAKIINTTLTDENGIACSCVVGSEMVVLTIDVLAERKIQCPIVGFQVLDRLGQVLFADNSSLVTRDTPFIVNVGHVFSAEFRFQIPLLPKGDYVMRVAVAMGETDGQAVMLHVVENALALHSITTGSRHGLIGVPMREIKLKHAIANV